MSREPRGLGKGLSALLGEVPSADEFRKPVGYVNKEIAGARPRQNTSDVLRIPVDMVEPNPFQPRQTFSEESLKELAASIKTLGLIQPITVRKISETQYQIISGERRFRACRMAGMSMVPAFVRDTGDVGMLEMAIVENIQREDLDPIEVALSYQRLIDECSLTQEQMSYRLGKKRTSVTNSLRLLKLPDKVQHDLKTGALSVGHAKVILGVDDPELQEKLCDLAVSGGLSVRQLEDKVRSLLKPAQGKSAKAPLPEEYGRWADRVGKYFPKGVNFTRTGRGSGTMTVRFSSDAELRAFMDLLEKAGE